MKLESHFNSYVFYNNLNNLKNCFCNFLDCFFTKKNTVKALMKFCLSYVISIFFILKNIT